MGWEPTETHRGYDQTGAQVPLAKAWEVVVTRDPEWTDHERDRLLALAQYEAEVCACGFHTSMTEDRDNHFTFEDRVCPVCRGADRYGRIQTAADKKASDQHGEHAPPGAPLPGDGRRTFVRVMRPDEVQKLREGGDRGNT